MKSSTAWIDKKERDLHDTMDLYCIHDMAEPLSNRRSHFGIGIASMLQENADRYHTPFTSKALPTVVACTGYTSHGANNQKLHSGTE